MKKIALFVSTVLLSQILMVGAASAARGTIPLSCEVSTDSRCNKGAYDALARAVSRKVSNSVKAREAAATTVEAKKKVCAIVRDADGNCSLRFNDGKKAAAAPSKNSCTFSGSFATVKCDAKGSRCSSAERKNCCKDRRGAGADGLLNTGDDVCSKTKLK